MHGLIEKSGHFSLGKLGPTTKFIGMFLHIVYTSSKIDYWLISVTDNVISLQLTITGALNELASVCPSSGEFLGIIIFATSVNKQRFKTFCIHLKNAWILQ